jgi:hypothetical protein
MAKSYASGSTSRPADKMGDTALYQGKPVPNPELQGRALFKEEKVPEGSVPPKELREKRKKHPNRIESSDPRYPKMFDV